MKNRCVNSRPLAQAALAASLTTTMFTTVAPAVQAAGGETPATGTLITNILFNDTGTTVGFVNDISTLPPGIGSPYTTVAGPDVFYRFTVATGGTLNVTVTGGVGYDTAIYLLKDGQLGTNAVIARDSTFGGGTTETFSGFALVGGSTYFLGIDSFYSQGLGNANGTYSLAMSGTAVLSSGAAAPEPGTFGLAALGAGALVLRRRNRKR